MRKPLIHKVRYRFGEHEIELSLEELEPPAWWNAELRKFFSVVNQLNRPPKIQYVRRVETSVTVDPAVIKTEINRHKGNWYSKGYSAGLRKAKPMEFAP